MHGGLQLCIESYVLWPFKTKEEKERETEDESLDDHNLRPWRWSWIIETISEIDFHSII